MIVQNLTPSEKEQLTQGYYSAFNVQRCLINHDWKLKREAFIVICRQLDGDRICAGIYMIDLLCQGITNVGFISELRNEDIKLYIDSRLTGRKTSGLEECEYSLCHEIILKGIDYAKKSGLNPHPDFKYLQNILETNYNQLPSEQISFGHYGRPYLRMSEDDPKLSSIIASLDKNIGAGNYLYSDLSTMLSGHFNHSEFERWTAADWNDFIDEFDADHYVNHLPEMDYLLRKTMIGENDTDILAYHIAHFFSTCIVGEDTDEDELQSERNLTEEEIEAIDSVYRYMPPSSHSEATKLLMKIEQYQKRWPGNYDFRILYIQLKISLGGSDLAQLLKEAIDDFPNHLPFRLTYALNLATADKINEATELLSNAIMIQDLAHDRKKFSFDEVAAFATTMALININTYEIFTAYLYADVIVRIGLEDDPKVQYILNVVNSGATALALDILASAKKGAKQKTALLSLLTDDL